MLRKQRGIYAVAAIGVLALGAVLLARLWPAPIERLTAAVDEVQPDSLLVTVQGHSSMDKARVGVNKSTRLVRADGSSFTLQELVPGQSVEIAFDGSVRESYPVQLTASKITLLAVGVLAGGTQAVYRTVSPQEAKERMEKESGILLLDVRTPEEHSQLRIPGSRLLPLDTIEAEAGQQLPDKEAVIFVYCRSGNRSKTAANLLVEMGYTQVYDMGGIRDRPYETESD